MKECFNQSANNSAHQTTPHIQIYCVLLCKSIPCEIFSIRTNVKNNANLKRSQISDAAILNKLGLLYFLKTVDLISAKFPDISSVKSAWSLEFMATFKVATWTNNINVWHAAYTKTTKELTAILVLFGFRVVFQYMESKQSCPILHMSRSNTSTMAMQTYNFSMACPLIQW